MKRFLPLFLVAAGVAVPASAQIVDRVIGHTTPGQVYVNYGYGQIKEVYDEDGKAEDAGSEAVLQRAAIGGSYNVAQAGDLGVFVGAELAMASAKAEAGSTTYESGFKPQMLGLGVGVRGSSYRFGVAYQYDLGNEPELSTSGYTPSNSDQSDAVVFGAEVYSPFSGVTITAGANYYLTLKQDHSFFTGASVVEAKVDPSDYLDVHVGAGYRVADVVELGLQARYLKSFDGEATLGSTTVTFEDAGYAIGLVPYLTLSPEFVPAQITLSASATREYTPYGLTLAGKNLPVGRFGFTVGARFGF